MNIGMNEYKDHWSGKYLAYMSNHETGHVLLGKFRPSVRARYYLYSLGFIWYQFEPHLFDCSVRGFKYNPSSLSIAITESPNSRPFTPLLLAPKKTNSIRFSPLEWTSPRLAFEGDNDKLCSASSRYSAPNNAMQYHWRLSLRNSVHSRFADMDSSRQLNNDQRLPKRLKIP